jgi:hypothetical protein
MANNSLTIHTNRFFALVLKSPIQMGWLSIINSVTNISRLGTFNIFAATILGTSALISLNLNTFLSYFTIFHHYSLCFGSGFAWIRIDLALLGPNPDPY